jgi:hypothetical protein
VSEEEWFDVAVASPARGSKRIETHVAWLVRGERDRLEMLRRTLGQRRLLETIASRGRRLDMEAWSLLTDVMDAVVMYVVQQHLRHDPWDLLSELAYRFEAMLDGNHGTHPLVAETLRTCIESIDDALEGREAPEDRAFPQRGALESILSFSSLHLSLRRWQQHRFDRDGGVHEGSGRDRT